MKKVSRKSFGLDAVRAFAIFSVIGGHFFVLYTPFRTTPVSDVSLILQSVANSILGCGVPLFIMLTGYLNVNKTICRTYYSKIWRVLFAYVLFSVGTLLFRHLVFDEPFTAVMAVRKTLDFSAIRYAWYIEMWIGLFLLVPFLNVLYKGIGNRRHKEILVLTLVFLTFVPALTNRYGLHLLPDYWKNCYPLTYYFIGSYIREYAPKINKLYALSAILVIGLVPPVFTMVMAPGHSLVQILGDSFSIFGAVSAVAVFLLLYDVKCPEGIASKAISRVSLLSLDMYLCCYMFDSIVYPWFKNQYYVDQSSFGACFFIIVPVIFGASLLLAWMKYMLFSLPGLVKFR